MDWYSFHSAQRQGQQGASDSDNILKNVNLFRGSVISTLVLVSLDGMDNMSFTLQAAYSGILGNQVRRSNATAPTSILGCGWTMPLSYIGMLDYRVSHNIQSDFYFISEGGRFPLYRKGEEQDYIRFVSVQHPTWEFRYYNDGDATRWTICKEDGSLWQFGGTDDSTEVHLAWKNWVGASSDNGAAPFPTGWYLSEIKSVNGAAISFRYDNVKVALGDSSYTGGMYLKSVVTTYGETVNLCYSKKEDFECEAYVEGQEAYQTPCDDRYLSSVEVFADNGAKLYTQELTYDFYSINGEDTHKKRYLTAVTQIMPEGKRMPSLCYRYAMDDAHCVPGALLGMKYPRGATVSFDYERMDLEQAVGNISVTPPDMGWETSFVHNGEYSVVKFTRDKQLCIRVLYWDAGWKMYEDETFRDEDVQDVRLMTGDNFFLVSYRSLSLGRNGVRIFRRKQARRAEWEVVELESESTDDQPAIACGNDFYAVQGKDQSRLTVYQYMPLEEAWEEYTLDVGSYDFVSLGAGKGFLLGAYYQKSSTLLRFCSFYADADGIWRQADVWDTHESVELQLTNRFSVWSVGKSEASASVVSVKGTEYADGTVFLLRWREDYSFSDYSIQRLRQTIEVKNPLLYSMVSDNVVGYAQKVFRHLPERWIDATLLEPREGGEYRYAYGEDLALAVEITSDSQRFYALRFDVSSGNWTRDDAPYCEDLYNEVSCMPYIGGRYAVLGRHIFYRDSAYRWKQVYSFPDYAGLDTIYMDPLGGYCLYGVRAQHHVVKLVFDGESVLEEHVLDGDCPDSGSGYCAGLNAFHLFRPNEGMQIYALLDKYTFDMWSAGLVTKVSLDAGSGSQTYALSYEKKGVRTEEFSPLFQKLRVYPVDKTATYGYVDYTYFNGLDERDEAAVYPPDDEYSNARSFYSFFTGQLFRKDVYGEGSLLERSTLTYNSALNEKGFVIRPIKTVDIAYLPTYDFKTGKEGEIRARESVIVNEYEKTYYQLRRSTKQGYFQGKRVGIGTELSYVWEKNEEVHQVHILTQTAYTKKYETKDNSVLEATATLWEKDRNGRWQQAVTLQWNGEGDPAYPKSDSAENWNVIERAVTRNDAGLITEQTAANGKGEYVLYDKNGTVEIARFSNAREGQAVYCGFEPYETMEECTFGGKAQITHDLCWSGSSCAALKSGDALILTLPNGVKDTPYLIRFAMKYRDTDGTVGTMKATVGGKTYSVQLSSRGDGWQIYTDRFAPEDKKSADGKITMEISGPEKGTLFVDAVFLTPLLCTADATVYAGNEKLLCARHSNLGGGTISAYDSLSRPMLSAYETGEWISCSRDNNNADALNSKVAALFSEDARLYPMYRGLDLEADWIPDASWKIQDKKLVNFSSKCAALTYKGESGSQYALYLATEGDYGTFKINSGNVCVQWDSQNGTVTENGKKLCAFRPETDTVAANRQDYLLVRLGQRLGFYSGEKELCLVQLKEEQPKGLTVEANGAGNITLLGMGKRPQLSVSYQDSVGVPIQDHLVTDDGVIVTQALYSPLRQQQIKTKPVELFGELWAYRDKLVTDFDETTGIMKGEAADQYPEDEGYPYSRSETTHSPDPYLTEMSQPGKDRAIRGKDSGYTARSRRYIPVGLPGGLADEGLFAQCAIEPDGKITFSITDSFDYKVMTLVQTADGEKQITSYENDIWGRLVKQFDPNMFDDQTKKQWSAQTLRYDPAGNLAECISLDAGTVRFVYDWRGRLHYEQPQDGAEEGWYIYHLYDELDREVEVGKELGKWDESALRKKANSGGGCSDKAVWSKRLRYDGEELGQNQLGRLWQCETCAEIGGVTETYIYDLWGNIIWMGQRLSEAEYGVNFAYDLNGKLLSQYVDGHEDSTVFYEYDLIGRMKRIRLSEHQICENHYDKAGMLETEMMTSLRGQTLTRSYSYNPAGWVTRIEDEHFCQSIVYRPENGLIDKMQVQIKQAPDGFAETLDTACTYDGFGRITKVALAQFPEHGLGTASELKYDSNSNLLSGDGMKYEYAQGSNRLTQGRDISYQYNAKGACTKREKNGAAEEITYDKVTNRVLTIQNVSGNSVYHHGANGVAACETESGNTRYLQDNNGRLFAKIDSDGTICLCIYGTNGVLAQMRNGAVYFMLKDYQSSVRAVWDGEKLCAAWHFAPLGQIIEGAYETDAIRELIPFRFAGQLLTDHGIYRTNYRFYDPETGRFLSVDPERQYNNPYLFGNCDWINYCDPDGAFSWGNFVASLITVAMGIICIGVGVGIAVGSGGAAVPLLTAIGGAAVAGLGFGTAIYGVTSLIHNDYDPVELLINGVSGAVMGALSAFAGALMPASLTGWSAILADTVVGAVIGAADGVVTNGVINAYHGRDFKDGWVKNMIIGGVLGGAFGAISGVGRAYNNQRLISSNLDDPLIYVCYKKKSNLSAPGHSILALDVGNSQVKTTDLIPSGTKRIDIGKNTKIRVFNKTSSHFDEYLANNKGQKNPLRVDETVYDKINNSIKAKDNGKYNYLINDCTSYVAKVLSKGGFTVPLWARSPAAMFKWASMLT